MNDKLKIGIVGCGGIAANHVEAYDKNGAVVAALADVRPATAEKLAEGRPDARVFPNFKALLDSKRVDAISICTPPSAHEEIAVYALERNIHVLCEKPLAHTVESGRRIAAAAAKSEARFMLAFRHRFLPSIRRIREIIDEGRIGEVVFLLNTFCGPAFDMKDKWFSQKSIAGGGTLMDTTSHSVDIFRFLAGEIVEQNAVSNRSFPATDVEDSSVLNVKSAHGALGSLVASWVAGDGVATLEVMGQSGRLSFDYYNDREILLKLRGGKDWEKIPVASSMGFVEEVAHFLGAIRNKEQVSCSVTDGLRALEVIQNVYAEQPTL